MVEKTLSYAIEESTYIISFTFKDESENLVIPNLVTWTLSDIDGNIINSREDVSITPATTVNVVLTGDDLSIGSNGIKRIVDLYATYDSMYGSDLKLRSSASFYIKDITTVS